MTEKPTGRARIIALLEDSALRPGQISGRGFAVTWGADRLVVKSGERTLEMGPGDGEQLAVQVSRSASWGERGFISRLLGRARPKLLWLNVRLRSRTGLQPVHLRARIPKTLDLVGIPVLPGLAVEVPTGALLDALRACVKLKVRFSDWRWDDTVELEVQDSDLSELSPLLEAPSTPNWILLCDWYDGLGAEQAKVLKPRLLGELKRWPEALREFNPDLSSLNLDPALRRAHHHLDLSCVLRITPLDEDTLEGDEPRRLSRSAMADQLTTLSLHNMTYKASTTQRLFSSDELIHLFNPWRLPSLRHVSARDFRPLTPNGFDKVLQGTLFARLQTLELREMHLKPAHVEQLAARLATGNVALRHLTLASDPDIGDDPIRKLIATNVVQNLQSLTLDVIGLSTDHALALIDDRRLERVTLHIAWIRNGKRIALSLPPSDPVTTLDLNNCALDSTLLNAILATRRIGPLTHLILHSNPLGGGAVRPLRATRSAKTLQVLDLSHCGLDGDAVAKLALLGHTTFPELRLLKLYGASLHKSARESLKLWRRERDGLEIMV